jgi:hypothetical protein
MIPTLIPISFLLLTYPLILIRRGGPKDIPSLIPIRRGGPKDTPPLILRLPKDERSDNACPHT